MGEARGEEAARRERERRCLRPGGESLRRTRRQPGARPGARQGATAEEDVLEEEQTGKRRFFFDRSHLCPAGCFVISHTQGEKVQGLTVWWS